MARRARPRPAACALINFGLSPFLYWWNQVPDKPFFLTMVLLLAVSALLFLGSLNLVLRRLGAMLPDETLRLETRQFTALNLNLLFATFCAGCCFTSALAQHSRPCRSGWASLVSCAGTRQPLVSDLADPAAPGHDHGAALEDQGSHPRQRVRRTTIRLPHRMFKDSASAITRILAQLTAEHQFTSRYQLSR